MSHFSSHCENMMLQLHILGFDLKYVQDFLVEFNSYCECYHPEKTKLTKELAEEWIHHYQTKSKQQLDKRIRTMKHLGKYLNSIGIDAYIPNYRITSDPTTPPTLFSDQQLSLFFDTCDCIRRDKRSGNREYIAPVMFRLIYSCGLRTSEACKLKMTDICLETGCIRIYHSKGCKDRQIYMSDSMLELCRQFSEKYNQVLPNREYFFQPSYKKVRYLNTDICTMFDSILKKSNLIAKFPKKPTPHGLRHLFAIRSMKKCT